MLGDACRVNGDNRMSWQYPTDQVKNRLILLKVIGGHQHQLGQDQQIDVVATGR